MNHPHDLLADLVDGTLDAERRAGVEAHLGTCDGCRADLAAAAAGRDAARSLPVVPVPANLHERVVVAGGSGGRPRWYRWVGAAAAAAVVAAIALALPDVGDEADLGGGTAGRVDSAEQAPAAADAEGGSATVGIETLDRDFSEGAIRRLAKESRRAVSLAGAAKDGSAAVRCIERSLGVALKGRLVRLIDARFKGTPAYIAVYLEGPGAQQAPDTSAVYVASKGDCRFLSTAAAKL
jgi:hypothetical protein